MQISSSVTDIAHVIQLAVAPVFLLSGVGVTLTVLTNRLSRIIDRARAIEVAPAPSGSATFIAQRAELTTLSRRAQLVHRAITLSTSCALLICLVILSLFAGVLMARDLSGLIAAIFIAAIVAFVGALLSFLREIFLATESLRFGAQHHAS
jgi:hypothetical protein